MVKQKLTHEINLMAINQSLKIIPEFHWEIKKSIYAELIIEQKPNTSIVKGSFNIVQSFLSDQSALEPFILV